VPKAKKKKKGKKRRKKKKGDVANESFDPSIVLKSYFQ
jgi:hypothetical protein